jgi:plasmid stabilization system protein ParE
MDYKLFIFPQAEDDIEYAAFWYELHRNGLGSEFILTIDAELNSIKRTPAMYPKVYKDYRRAIINRFPYGIFYIINDDSINILAVIHLSRNPKTFKKRT